MATTKEEKAATRIVTPEALFSHPHVFRPQMPPSEAGEPEKKPEFSVALVFLPGSELTGMKQAAIAAAKQKFGADKAIEMIRAGKLRMPFRADPDDIKEKGYPEGSMFFNARSKDKPDIVSRYAGPDGKPTPITNESEIYPGVVGRASINFYAYDRKGNKGVAAGLNNLQKLRDGARLDSRKAAKDEFEADLNEAPASLDDVTGMV